MVEEVTSLGLKFFLILVCLRLLLSSAQLLLWYFWWGCVRTNRMGQPGVAQRRAWPRTIVPGESSLTVKIVTSFARCCTSSLSSSRVARILRASINSWLVEKPAYPLIKLCRNLPIQDRERRATQLKSRASSFRFAR